MPRYAGPMPPRFIPAPAGNTHVPNGTREIFAVHPRACGEHQGQGLSLQHCHGSSPRLRGTQGDVLRFRRIDQVHPRACGEHPPQLLGDVHAGGSSPRLRGTHTAEMLDPEGRRFIPAPAGNTRECRSPKARVPVHPRACGEHLEQTAPISLPSGSSPRLRGTPAGISQRAVAQRFIPAPAGNTNVLYGDTDSITVHPRACGEHPGNAGRNLCRCGSSPRLRGTLSDAQVLTDRRRFIPAPAGNTPVPDDGFPGPPVHPRACGEHF